VLDSGASPTVVVMLVLDKGASPLAAAMLGLERGASQPNFIAYKNILVNHRLLLLQLSLS
jgi:hypothetical protein